MKVLYFYYFQFYQKILNDSEPHLLTTLVLSFSISLPVIFLVNSLLTISLCHTLNYWDMGLILFGIILINFAVFHRNEEAKKIIKAEPKFFDSQKISLIITILFFIVTTSLLFVGPDLINKLRYNCV